MNKNFDDWARDLAPPMGVDEVSRKAHLTILKDRLRTREITRRRRRVGTRRASMVALVVLVTFLGGNLSELGSDGFDHVLKPVESRERLRATVGHRETRVGVRSEEAAPEMIQKTEMDLGHPELLDVVIVKGTEQWTVSIPELLSTGERYLRTRTPHGMEALNKGNAAGHLNFFANYEQDWATRITNGHAQPVATEIIEAEGQRFLTRVYQETFPGLGVVTWKKGERISSE